MPVARRLCCWHVRLYSVLCLYVANCCIALFRCVFRCWFVALVCCLLLQKKKRIRVKSEPKGKQKEGLGYLPISAVCVQYADSTTPPTTNTLKNPHDDLLSWKDPIPFALAPLKYLLLFVLPTAAAMKPRQGGDKDVFLCK